MPYVRAIRGVCIGPDRHLSVGDVADVPVTDARFLVSIGAVQECAAPTNDEPQPKTEKPAKAGGRE